MYSISLVIGRSIACRGFVSTTPDIGVRPPLTLEFESTFSLSRSMLSKPRPTLMLSHLCPFRNLKDENSAAQESMLEETGQKTTPEPSQVPPQDESKEDNRQGRREGWDSDHAGPNSGTQKPLPRRSRRLWVRLRKRTTKV